MSREEELIRSTTRAIASTVHEVPPLRLEAAAGELPRARARGGRTGDHPGRWWSWGAPLAAAAVIVALAVTLALVRDLPGRDTVVPRPANSASPDSVPRYYAAITQVTGKDGKPTTWQGVEVGDSVTGRTVATFAPPANSAFFSVTAAADDRTFVVMAVSADTGTLPKDFGNAYVESQAKGPLTATFYELKLTPGRAHPATLTTLPITPWSWGPAHIAHGISVPAPGTVLGVALSQSGREIAVAGIPAVPAQDRDAAADWSEVKVFSLATGQLLHDWTGHDPATAFGYTSWESQALTWIDGDRALDLTTGHADGSLATVGTVRRLAVAGPAHGDLTAASTVLWSGPLQPYGANNCYTIIRTGALISADGKSVSCGYGTAAAAGRSRPLDNFETDPLPPGAGATAKPQIAYELPPLVSASPSYGAAMAVLWVSPSGGTLIGTWSYLAQAGTTDFSVRTGVISRGQFRPLQVPSSLANLDSVHIAW